MRSIAARMRKPAGMKSVHLHIVGEHSPFGGSPRETLWCREHADIPAGTHTTKVPSEVTCKRCIALGGCGPGWKS